MRRHVVLIALVLASFSLGVPVAASQALLVRDGNSVWVLSGANPRQLIAGLHGAGVERIAISRDQTKAYTAGESPSYAIDLISKTKVDIVHTRPGSDWFSNSYGVAIRGKTAYIADYINNRIMPIDLPTHSTREPIPGFKGPWDIAIAPDA